MKNNLPLALIALAIALFCLIWFWFMPQRERTAAETHARQQDALTHDIAAVAAYQSPYIGDAVNATHLFEALPLGDIAKKYHINSAQCTLTVHYQDALERHDAQEIRRGAVYNAAAAFASIQNLSALTLEWEGGAYSFSRAQVEAILGAPLPSPLDKAVWKLRVQARLSDPAFLAQFFA